MATNKDLWKIKLINDCNLLNLRLSDNSSSIIEEAMQKMSLESLPEELTYCPNCNDIFSDISNYCSCGLFKME